MSVYKNIVILNYRLIDFLWGSAHNENNVDCHDSIRGYIACDLSCCERYRTLAGSEKPCSNAERKGRSRCSDNRKISH